jgi:hypothetical protein
MQGISQARMKQADNMSGEKSIAFKHCRDKRSSSHFEQTPGSAPEQAGRERLYQGRHVPAAHLAHGAEDPLRALLVGAGLLRAIFTFLNNRATTAHFAR